MSDYVVEVVVTGRQPAVAIRAPSPPASLGAAFGERLPRIADWIVRNEIDIVGPPYGRYHAFSADRIDLEVGVPVAAPVGEGEGDIRPSELPGCEAAVTWHIGPYDTLGQAHAALETWVAANGRVPAGGPWEIYVTDPAEEPDASLWRTQVFLPLV